jgi:type IV secretion system protein VirB4
MAMPYRFTQRMIYMDPVDATKEIGKYTRQWGQKVRGFVSILFNQQGGTVNQHAMDMRTDAEAAKSLAESGDVLFGWYSATVVLRHGQRDDLEEMVRAAVRAINDSGFSARIETTNTIEAWRGALPGDTDCQVRRPLLHTRNLADLLPLSGVWTGRATAPCPLYPQPSPPLMYAATVGGIPFRVNLHVDDVGHTLIFGPTGAGKSTLLATTAFQARRYPGMSIWAFDFKRGLLATAKACGGQHYELGGSESPALCPLAQIDTPVDLGLAEEWILTGLGLQGWNQERISNCRDQVHLAIERLREHPDHRSLSDFVLACQDIDVRKAMAFYTLEGAAGHLLDARKDSVATSHFNVFETIDLMALGNATSLPVLLTLFRRFERSLDGRPCLLFLDEAWVALGHPVWREKLRDWLKLLRSKNCAVIMATQSLSDAVRSGLIDVLNESCPTKIYLPNNEALKTGTTAQPGPHDFYQMMGLNENQIEIIRTARPKRDYYFVSPEGCRLIDMALGPAVLAFAGATDSTAVTEINSLEAAHGADWPFVHLKNKGVDHAALA